MHASWHISESVRRAPELSENNSIDRNDTYSCEETDDYVCDETEESIIIRKKSECEHNRLTSNNECVSNEENIAYEFFRLYSTTNRESILSNATLERALNIFDMPNLLRELDQDLELVQKQLNSKEDHASYFNQNVNDKFRKLSLKYHPDRINSKGGTKEEIKKATELQTAVNIVWSILKALHNNFIENNYFSDQDFKYSTCSAVEIAILNNEKRLKSLNNKILVELCWLSRIKQEKMIPNLNKFLNCCELCMQSFISEDEVSFEKGRMQALSLFNLFFSGYNVMFNAVVRLRDVCERNDDLAYIKSMVEKLVRESRNHIDMLKRMKKLYFQQFVNIKQFKKRISKAEIDFVSPFAEYSALLFICKEIAKEKSEGNKRRSKIWLGNIATAMSACMPSILKDGQYEFARDALELDASLFVHGPDFHSANSLNENFVKKKRKMREEELANLRKKLKDKAGSDVHYDLLSFLASYYCQKEKEDKFEVNRILKQELKLAVDIHWETCLEPLNVIIITYAEYLKEKFRPIKVYSEVDIKDLMKDIEKMLEDFTATMRKEARKGQQEVREAQIRITNELNKMDKDFEAAIKEAENKSAQRFENIEAKLREDERNRNRLVEILENERQERAKREVEIQKDLEESAKVDEEKLREESEKAYKEREEILTKQLQELKKTMSELLESSNG